MMTLYNVLLSPFLQDGKTALYLASEQGHVSVVRILIAAHAAVSLKDKVLQPIRDCMPSSQFLVFSFALFLSFMTFTCDTPTSSHLLSLAPCIPNPLIYTHDSVFWSGVYAVSLLTICFMCTVFF